MGRPRKDQKARFDFRLFNRGGTLLYARFIDTEADGRVVATRSTGTDDENEARKVAAQLLAALPLARIAEARTEGMDEDLAEEERLRRMKAADFFTWFWSPEGDYVEAKAASSEPLSAEYLKNNRQYIAAHVAGYAPWKRLALRDLNLLSMERFIRHLRESGVRGGTINRTLDALQRPIRWAADRELIDSPPSFRGLSRPEGPEPRRRGILTPQEVAALIALPTAEIWQAENGAPWARLTVKPRPRLKGGAQYSAPAPVDLRQKAVVLLAELAGLRRGEIRGLRWGAVDLKAAEIHVVENFVRGDGTKRPKRDSRGVVPIADALLPVLVKLKEAQLRLGWASPDDYVIPNTTRGVPVAEATMVRGYARALEAIGIPDDPGSVRSGRKPIPGSRQARGLSLHSGRHGFATLLTEAIGEHQAAKMTRHRSAAVLREYANHETAEAIRQARAALRKAGGGE